MAQALSFPLAASVDVPAMHWDGQMAADIFAPFGTPWLAVFDGVAQPIDVPDGGHALLLTADDGTTAYYAHGGPERVGGRVSAGQMIGSVSDSGNAKGTGAHLHFAVGRINDAGGGTIQPSAFLAGASGGPEVFGSFEKRGLALFILAAGIVILLVD